MPPDDYIPCLAKISAKQLFWSIFLLEFLEHYLVMSCNEQLLFFITRVFRRKNVRFSTTCAKVVIDILVRTISLLNHFSFNISFIMYTQRLILRRLNVYYSDVSLDENKKWSSSSANFRNPCLQNFKRSSAAPKRYLVLFSFVPTTEETSQLISLLWEFLDLAAPISDKTNSCSKPRCKFRGVVEGCEAVSTQHLLSDTFLLGSGIYF